MKVEKKEGYNKSFVVVIIVILALGFFLQFGNFGNYIDKVDKQDTSGSATLITGQPGRGDKKDTSGAPPPIMGFPTGNDCNVGNYQGSCSADTGVAYRCIGGKEWGEKCKNGKCFTYTDSNGNTQARCTGNCYRDCKQVCIDHGKYVQCVVCPNSNKQKYEIKECPEDKHCENGDCVPDKIIP